MREHTPHTEHREGVIHPIKREFPQQRPLINGMSFLFYLFFFSPFLFAIAFFIFPSRGRLSKVERRGEMEREQSQQLFSLRAVDRKQGKILLLIGTQYEKK